MENNQNSHTFLVEVETGTAILENWQYLLKYNIMHILQPRNSTVIISPTDMCVFGHQRTCTRMFPAALFIIDLNWETIQMSINSEMYKQIQQ